MFAVFKLFLATLIVWSCDQTPFPDKQAIPTAKPNIEKLREIKEKPHVLIVSTHQTSINIESPGKLSFDISGGIPMVLQGSVDYLLPFLQKKTPTAKASLLFSGECHEEGYIVKIRNASNFIKTLEIPLTKAKKTVYVDLYEAKNRGGMSIYSLHIKDRFLDHAYSENPGRTRALKHFFISRVVARVVSEIGANIVHLHDRSAVDRVYLPDDLAYAITLHHSAAEFATIPLDEKGFLELEEITDLPQEILHKYFPYDVTLNAIVAGTRFMGEKELFKETFVSEGFAEEMEKSNEEFFKLAQENGEPVSKLSDAVPNNYGIDFFPASGIANGFDQKLYSAENHPDLYPMPPNANIWGHRWEQDMHFSADNFKEQKKVLKQLIQQALGLEVSEHKPLFVSISRIDYQKGIKVFIESAKHIISLGGQVIIAGPSNNDPYAQEAKKQLQEIIKEHPHQIYFHDGYVFGHFKTALLAGSDFFVITSNFEPCGLTDYEAASLGSIVIGRQTGGIGKVKSGLYYKWFSNLERISSLKLSALIEEEALPLFYHKDKLQAKVKEVLSEKFSWDKNFEQYYNLYFASYVYKILNNQSNMSQAEQHQLFSQIHELFKEEPDILKPLRHAVKKGLGKDIHYKFIHLQR